jgi:hypothetical protein
MATSDFADRYRRPLPWPIDTFSPHPDDVPRCRHCAAVLVVAHLRCDDGALLPVYRCPICRHVATAESSHVAPVLRDRRIKWVPFPATDD